MWKRHLIPSQARADDAHGASGARQVVATLWTNASSHTHIRRCDCTWKNQPMLSNIVIEDAGVVFQALMLHRCRWSMPRMNYTNFKCRNVWPGTKYRRLENRTKYLINVFQGEYATEWIQIMRYPMYLINYARPKYNGAVLGDKLSAPREPYWLCGQWISRNRYNIMNSNNDLPNVSDQLRKSQVS